MDWAGVGCKDWAEVGCMDLAGMECLGSDSIEVFIALEAQFMSSIPGYSSILNIKKFQTKQRLIFHTFK